MFVIELKIQLPEISKAIDGNNHAVKGKLISQIARTIKVIKQANDKKQPISPVKSDK